MTSDMTMASDPIWICCRQRAGPLTKESRSIRPRLSRADSQYDRAQKNQILRPSGDSSVCRSRVDRLELRLALFGAEGRTYTLTFCPQHEPEKWQDVRKCWRSFLRRLKLRLGRAFDYIYLIEGRHGDHRFHIHLVLRDSDFSPDDVAALWQFGSIESDPLIRHSRDTYRRTAKYFNKEMNDGVRIPVGARTWVCSKSLTAKLPPVETFQASSGDIPIPDTARISGRNQLDNEFGQYRYAWFIDSKTDLY